MALLSLKESIGELDRLDNNRQAAVETYIAAIRTSAETLVEFDAEAATRTRDRLTQLAADLSANSSVGSLRDSRKAFGSHLSDFQQTAKKCLDDLRRNLGSTVKTLQELMNQAYVRSAHHEGLEADISQLHTLQTIDNLASLRLALREMASRLTRRVDELKREHHIAIAQLQDEIRILHQQLETRSTPQAPPTPNQAGRSAADSAAVGMRRPDLENVIRSKAEQGETFCLTVVWLSNLPQLFARFAPDSVIELMDRAAHRLQEALNGNPFWARWEDDCIIVCSSESKQAAARTSTELAGRLAGIYRVRAGDSIQELMLRVSVGVVENIKGEPVEKVVNRAGTLLKGLRAS